MIDPSDITGVVLAGGRGSRMGGVDKGLQNFHGMPLALHTLLRLQPQVGIEGKGSRCVGKQRRQVLHPVTTGDLPEDGVVRLLAGQEIRVHDVAATKAALGVFTASNNGVVNG